MSTSATVVSSSFLSDAISARNAAHSSPAHAAPDRSHAAMGLLLDDAVLPLGAQSVLVQALELFRDAKATVAAAHQADDSTTRLAELGAVDVVQRQERSRGLAAVHAALDKLQALHAHQRALIDRAAMQSQGGSAE